MIVYRHTDYHDKLYWQVYLQFGYVQIAPRSYERSVRDCISYPLEVSYHLCTYLHTVVWMNLGI